MNCEGVKNGQIFNTALNANKTHFFSCSIVISIDFFYRTQIPRYMLSFLQGYCCQQVTQSQLERQSVIPNNVQLNKNSKIVVYDYFL